MRARPRPRGGDHPVTPGLSGVAPRAQIGNYRVFNVPDSGRLRRQHARDRRRVRGGRQRRHGRDQLLGRRAADRPGERRARRGGEERRRRRRRPRHLGGQRPRRLRARLRRLARDLARRDLGRSALEHACVRTRRSPSPRPARRGRTRIPFARAAGEPTPAAWVTSDQPLVDVGTLIGVNGAPVPRNLCGPPGNPTAARHRSRRLPARGDRARLARHLHVRAEGGAREGGRRDRDRPRRQPRRRGERHSARARGPGGMIADRDGAALRALSRRPRRPHGDPRRPRRRRSSSPAAAASSRASRRRA